MAKAAALPLLILHLTGLGRTFVGALSDFLATNQHLGASRERAGR